MQKKNYSTMLPAIIGLAFAFSACTSTNKNYNMPTRDQYAGYKLIDSVDKDTVAASIAQDDKVAIVVRNIVTTSYSYLEPRYNNSMVHFDGKSQCCAPDNNALGNSGLLVYKFSFIGKGKTTIQLVARQKGLSTTANSFDTDRVLETNLDVN